MLTRQPFALRSSMGGGGGGGGGDGRRWPFSPALGSDSGKAEGGLLINAKGIDGDLGS